MSIGFIDCHVRFTEMSDKLPPSIHIGAFTTICVFLKAMVTDLCHNRVCTVHPECPNRYGRLHNFKSNFRLAPNVKILKVLCFLIAFVNSLDPDNARQNVAGLIWFQTV